MCTKFLLITIEELIERKVINNKNDIKGIMFLAQVKGTPPQNDDAFRCYIQVLDSEQKEIFQLKHNSKDDLSICLENGAATQILL